MSKFVFSIVLWLLHLNILARLFCANVNWQGRQIKNVLRAMMLMPVSLLISCSGIPGPDFSAISSSLNEQEPSAEIPKSKIDTPARKKAAEGLQALEKNKLRVASNRFNEALKSDIQNSYLQFLNGMTYHLLATNGSSQGFALAEQGYKLAAKFDNSNWLAHYYYAQLYMDQKKWSQAQEEFAQAALINPDDRDLLYWMAAASYYAGDPASAKAILQRLLKLGPGGQNIRRVYQSLSITNAALNNSEQAEQYFTAYRTSAGSGANMSHLRQRIDSWGSFHTSSASKLWKVASSNTPSGTGGARRYTQFVEPEQSVMQGNRGFTTGGEAEGQRIETPTSADQFVNTDMVVVDVVMIGTLEDDSQLRGINLLSGLQVQFGNPFSQNPAAFSWSRNSEKEKILHPQDSSNIRTIIKAVQIPGITYSLNIVNSNQARSEIIAKPTLTALVGETSEFFSGTDIIAAAVSGAAGDSVSVEKQVGVKLQVTPELLPGDQVKLKILAERTFLKSPSQDVRFQFRLDTTKTSVNANVALRYGQTLILSGLMERVTENARDGVPLLQNIPGIKYFSSERTKRVFNKSVLILLTPRRPQYYGQRQGRGGKGFGQHQSYKPAIEKLFNRYPDNFSVPRITNSIFQHLQFSQLYNEFRTGDYPLERWNHSRSHRRRLNMARQYIYN